MKREIKFFAIAGGIAAAIVTILFLRRGAPQPPPETVLGASVGTISVFDAFGEEVPHNSTIELERGASYTVQATVTNLSSAGGNPVGANLKTLFRAMADSWSLMAQAFVTNDFGPGETLIISAPWPISVPTNIPSSSGEIVAIVYDPENHPLATGSLPIIIP